MKLVNVAGVRIPITISLQFTELPFELSAASSDLTKQPFLATVTLANYVSDGCVGGTEVITDENNKAIGPLRIFIPEKVMRARVGELMGKGVFAAEELDTHEGSVVVGQFVDAYMERIRFSEYHEVRASGFFDKRDNTELIAKIIDRARSGELGFSYDLKEAPGHLDTEMCPGETVLVLDDFQWRGATVLRREKAAYYYTNLAATRLAKIAAFTASSSANDKPTLPAGTSTSSTPSGQPSGEIEMTPEQLAAAIAKALEPLTASVTKLNTTQEGYETRFAALEAAVKPRTDPAPAITQQPATLTAEKLAETIGTATATAITAAFKAAGIGPDAPAGTGQRQTYSAAQLETVKRFVPDSASEGDLSVEGLNAAIQKIRDDFTLSAEAKTRAQDILVPMRNQLQREAMGVN